MKCKKLPNKLAVVRLGYVGLPLSVAFARYFSTLGFDISEKRINSLKQLKDCNEQIRPELLKNSNLEFTSNPEKLKHCDFIIIAVPTPVDKAKQPDLSYLISATKIVGKNLKKSSTVVYESTVYPGCTEEICIPILEKESGLKAGKDFKVGYSPERINPGDKEHTLENIVKIVAGMDTETTELLADVYGKVVKAGVYKAPDIKTAEAAKVIENIQRDINIALMNELSILFKHLGLNTKEVLKAARTKWNFLPFHPGLVGGHCIPVDPYYLTYKAQQIGYHPEVILAGRRFNDKMGQYVAQQTVKLLIKAGVNVKNSKILVFGVAYKPDVPDTRDSRVFELIEELQSFGTNVWVYDPVVPENDLKNKGIRILKNSPFESSQKTYEALILAVPHSDFKSKSIEDYRKLLPQKSGIFVDVYGVFYETISLNRDFLYWTL